MRGSLTHLPRIKSIKSFIKMMNNWDDDGAPCRMPQVVVNTVEHFPFSVNMHDVTVYIDLQNLYHILSVF